ncbi:MAG: putative Na+/H+ antiporter [Burkholderiales bacterium]|nr:putative Na+/H+ antiporter [Burkholderiales bacterium]
MSPSTTQIVAATLFALAIAHTFLAPKIASLGHRFPGHEGLFHLFGEVEAVFGMWSGVLLIYLFATGGFKAGTGYIDGLNFTEPLFVIAIMVVAASKPVLHVAKLTVTQLARLIPLPRSVAFFWLILTLVPLLGSFITEPAAMTLGAFMLRDRFFRAHLSPRLRYATIGVLFVNVSIGGVLTPYAAPPVLMVAAKWDWNLAFMLTHFGWRAVLAVVVSATVVTALFFREIKHLSDTHDGASEGGHIPASVCLVHLGLLAGVVVFAHHPPLFMGFLLMFLGVASAYPRFQDRLILREALMVGFFLAGLVVLGAMQQWWLQPLLLKMSPNQVYFGATALTAITDNAALTYLGSLVSGLTPEFKYMLVAGAVTGGGLTVIANAPNPAGYAILKPFFENEHISPLWLFVAAAGPTLIAIVCFWALPS